VKISTAHASDFKEFIFGQIFIALHNVPFRGFSYLLSRQRCDYTALCFRRFPFNLF